MGICEGMHWPCKNQEIGTIAVPSWQRLLEQTQEGRPLLTAKMMNTGKIIL